MGDDVPGLTRRHWCGGILAALGTLVGGGCATLTVSPKQERELGHEQAVEVERTVGLVRVPALLAYFRQVSGRLARSAERSDVAWGFNIADDTEPNAFALPGGWVYVTRGLLALTNSEDELAGVLGHEMAHVLQRHAVRRLDVASPFALLFGVPAGILGTVSPTLGGLVGGAGRLASGLALAPYSREQEREADRVGIALAARAGWDAAGLASLLSTLERQEALGGRDPERRSFFSTHPSTPERVRDVQTEARALASAPATPIAAGRQEFLRRLDGLVVDDNPAYGVFVGPLFMHPDFELALAMPDGWKRLKNAEAAGAVAPDGDAAVLLQLAAQGDDPVAGARADGLSEAGIRQLQRREISGLPAVGLLADTRDGDRVILTWIALRGRIFRVMGLTAKRDWERHGAALERVATTMRPLRASERERIMETRLRVRSSRAGETVAQVIAKNAGTWTAAQAAVANGITPDARLPIDWPVKVPIRQTYAGASGVRP